MSEQVDQQQTEDEAMASMMAGYGAVRGDEPPTEQAEPELENELEPQEAELPQAEPEPTVASLAEELKAFKARIATSTGDANEIRKLHGAVGDINRTLKALQTPAKAEEAPADDELAAALKSAEDAAEEYPEVVGPLVNALKASLKRQPAQTQPKDFDQRVTTAVSRAREADALEALAEAHPDFETVRETPEYKTWLASKTPEFQERFLTTWNPAVVAKGLTEFKDSLKTRERKQSRLAAAVIPQGTTQRAGPSTLKDEDGLLIGYNSGPKRHTTR